jgi:alpha-amylase
MTFICLTFQVHYPLSFTEYDFFRIGHDHSYFETDSERFKHFVENGCQPANRSLQRLLRKSAGRFKCALSLSGTFIDQMQQWDPDLFISFSQLAGNRQVELLGQSYYHSACFLYSADEFDRQVDLHRQTILELFQVPVSSYYNIEPTYGNDIAKAIEAKGFSGFLNQESGALLMGRSPNQVYLPLGTRKMRSMLIYQPLSENLNRHFSDTNWPGYPLSPTKVLKDLLFLADKGDSVINLLIDYRTLSQPGFISLLENLIDGILQAEQLRFLTPSEALQALPVKGTYDAPSSATWAEVSKDLPAGLENYLQREAIERLFALEKAIKSSGKEDLLRTWGWLQCIDYRQMMGNGSASRYDTYINYMNVLTDLEQRVQVYIH